MSDDRVPLIDALTEILEGYEEIDPNDHREVLDRLLACILEIAADADCWIKDGAGVSLVRGALRAVEDLANGDVTDAIREAAESQGASVRVGPLPFPGLGPLG